MALSALSIVIHEQVADLLRVEDVQTTRLVCKAWRDAFSQAFTRLAPKMQANAVGLQWSELGKIQVSQSSTFLIYAIRLARR